MGKLYYDKLRGIYGVKSRFQMQELSDDMAKEEVNPKLQKAASQLHAGKPSLHLMVAYVRDMESCNNRDP